MVVVRIVLLELVACGMAAVQPAVAVPAIAIGCFAAGFVCDPADSDRTAHRRRFHRLFLVHAVLVGLAWSVLGTSETLVQHGLVGVALGMGLGSATAALALIGMDARRHARGA